MRYHPRMLTSYDDFKQQVTATLEQQGRTRSGLARQMEADGLLRAHTVRCLLGSPGTRIGRRKPTFDSVLKIAAAAGLRVSLDRAS